METKIVNLATSQDLAQSRPEPKLAAPITGGLPSQIAAGVVDEADLRLVIEGHGNSYIYKTVNRRTGETITQYPREDVLKFQTADSYEAGQVIRAKA